MNRRISAFFGFWYDFIVGDDWRVAVGVVVALAVTYSIATTTVAAWWVLPAAVAILLPMSIWRVGRRARPSRTHDASPTCADELPPTGEDRNREL